MKRTVILRFPRGDILLSVGAFLLILTACAGSPKPDWVDGPKSFAYPENQFLVGVGQGDSRAIAEERAYAAISRIFKAHIISQSKDLESYLNLERKGSRETERRLTVETMTKVSTERLLENVRIGDTWKDPKTKQYSALAVLERGPTRVALSRRIAELDAAIERDIKDSRGSDGKLVKLRQLHRAVSNLMSRETLNRDLGIVTGQLLPSGFSVSELTRELEQFLQDSVVVTVEVKGDQADDVRQAIIETLLREGMPVTTKLPAEGVVPDLTIIGEARLWTVDLPDPKFRYVRWCGDFTLISPATQRIIGTVARSGREGHLNYREASNRALIALKQEIGGALIRTLSDQLYGQASPDPEPLSAACPGRSGP